MTDSSTATLRTISEPLKNEFIQFLQNSKAKPAQSFVVLKEFIDANLIPSLNVKRSKSSLTITAFPSFKRRSKMSMTESGFNSICIIQSNMVTNCSRGKCK